jgi:hypothetical protein
MKALLFLLALTAGWALTAQQGRADDPVVQPVQLPPSNISQSDAQPASANPPAAPDAAVLPSGGFPASRYETLWTKSPFAVATSETAVDTSPDYMFVGFANVDGISYASVIDAHNQEHFLISTDRPNRGLTLTSITRSHDGSDTFAVVQKDGQSITLKLEQPPASAPIAGMNMQPGGFNPQIPMPGSAPSFPGGTSIRPFPARFHRPIIHLPPPPQPQSPPISPPPPPSQ